MYSEQDRLAQHRYKADESYKVGVPGDSPVGAYLNQSELLRIGLAAKEQSPAQVLVHPGYGLLSENATFADAVHNAGLTWVGPDGDTIRLFGDKVSARKAAIEAGLPTVPGSDGPLSSVQDAKDFAAEYGYPVIIKAVAGGGGKGMRKVEHEGELEDAYERASGEAAAAFGDGTVFIERFVPEPRHIEVQIIGDGTGAVVHLGTRDCSLQRRHQKVVETAPARDVPQDVLDAMCESAVRLAASVKYKNAGTVEYLLGADGRFYFLEVNPRVQVEHTVTEEVTGIDIVQTQLRIAGGATLAELGLDQDRVRIDGVAIQARLTTEVPEYNFAPDSGVISVYRSATGPGIRLDDGPGYTGAHITPFYDSLLCKVTAHAPTFEGAAAKLRRALSEFRVRGVSTNKSFILNVLAHPDFLHRPINTGFLEQHSELLAPRASERNRADRLIRYLAEVSVNGPEAALGATGSPCAQVEPTPPALPLPSSGPPPGRAKQCLHMGPGVAAREGQASAQQQQPSLRQIYRREGPAAFAKAVRQRQGLLVTDTTWRDAHQSLLATRVRTRDMLAIAPATAEALAPAYSLECWGGATFDVCARFLRESPWDRLEQLREAVPDIPFQMLLRGANAVGYTSYPDNAVEKFCDVAVRSGMDVFRVFDSLNYMPNLRLGMDAVGAAGGIIEACLCYTGDVLSGTNKAGDGPNPYNLAYYLDLARQLVDGGCHVLAIKDMAGLLKPDAATALVGALRAEFPDLPIHVHTHDSAALGVASMLAAAQAGADAVDAATDALSGTTSQPSLGAIVNSLRGTPLDTGLDPAAIAAVNDYWEVARGLYAPFESGQLAPNSKVFYTEMPGGQYTNLLMSTKAGLGPEHWPAVQEAYAQADRALGSIPKVTPSSKVVGDLAAVMTAAGIKDADELVKNAGSVDMPESVIDFMRGGLGEPPLGWPARLRDAVLQRAGPDAAGRMSYSGRPGAELAPLDWDAVKRDMLESFGPSAAASEQDTMTYVMYPAVFAEYHAFKAKYGDVSVLPTRAFVSGLQPGEELSFDLEPGKTLICKLEALGAVDSNGMRDVLFMVNGEPRKVQVRDAQAAGLAGSTGIRSKADKGNARHVPAPMPGAVVNVRVAAGDTVVAGQPLLVMSAMKMETMVKAPRDGKVTAVHCAAGDTVAASDLLVELE